MIGPLDLLYVRIEFDRDANASRVGDEARDEVAVELAQRTLVLMQDRHLCARTGRHVGEFERDVATSE